MGSTGLRSTALFEKAQIVVRTLDVHSDRPSVCALTTSEGDFRRRVGPQIGNGEDQGSGGICR